MTRLFGLSVAGLCVLLSGCVYDHGDFTVLTNRLIDTRNFDLSSVEQAERVEGEDARQIIIVFPTGEPSPEAALENALEEGRGDVMVNASIRYSFFYIPYIYGEAKWIVEGDVLSTKSQRPQR